MTRLGKTKTVLTALGTLLSGGAIAVALVVGGQVPWKNLSSAEATVGAAIIAASATVAVSMLSVVIGKYLESRAKIREEHRQKKVPVYEELIQFMFSVLLAQKVGREPLSEREINEFFAGFMPKLVVWGATNVILSFGDMREFSAKLAESGRAREVLIIYESVLFEIRNDLGNQGTLGKGDLLRLFITDIRQSLN